MGRRKIKWEGNGKKGRNKRKLQKMEKGKIHRTLNLPLKSIYHWYKLSAF